MCARARARAPTPRWARRAVAMPWHALVAVIGHTGGTARPQPDPSPTHTSSAHISLAAAVRTLSRSPCPSRGSAAGQTAGSAATRRAPTGTVGYAWLLQARLLSLTDQRYYCLLQMKKADEKKNACVLRGLQAMYYWVCAARVASHHYPPPRCYGRQVWRVPRTERSLSRGDRRLPSSVVLDQ